MVFPMKKAVSRTMKKVVPPVIPKTPFEIAKKTFDYVEEYHEIRKLGGTTNVAFEKKVMKRIMNPNGKPLEWVMLKAFKDEASTVAILVYTARRERGKHDYFSLKIGAVGTHAEEAGILYAKAFVPIRYDYASLEHNAVGNPRLLFDVSGTIQKLVALAIDFITEQQIELRKTRRLEVVTKESQELLKGTKKKGKTEPPKRVPLPEEYKHLPVKKYKM